MTRPDIEPQCVSTRPCPTLVIVQGDPECEHVFYYHGRSRRDGIVWAEFECGRCGRVIAERGN
jgi:hypothetical protein